MFKNYFYLKRCLQELPEVLFNQPVLEIYTQEKNKLHFHIPISSSPNRHLVLSINPQFPFILVKDEHHKAKRNVINFLNDILPQKITELKIAQNDRVIKIGFDSLEVFFMVRGSKSNIIFHTNEFGYVGFKKEENIEKIKNEVETITFTEPNSGIVINFDNTEVELANLKKHFPIIPKEAISEVQHRFSKEINYNSSEYINIVLEEIKTKPISVGFDQILQKVRFLPDSFTETKSLIYKTTHSTYNQAIQNYISLYFRLKKKTELKKILSKYIDRELEKVSNKLNNLRTRIEKGSKEKQYNKIGNLLLVNRHLLKKGMGEIKVSDYDANNIMEIKLDEKLSPQQNIDKYFEKSHDEKINYNKSIELYDKAKTKYKSLQEKSKVVKSTDNIDLLQNISNDLKIGISKKMKPIENKTQFRHFLIDKTYHCYVGRDSKENDYLSLKFAKQNDYWFHARGLPGSHVVLKVENTKETIPKNIIKKAASIAAYYSKGKTASLIPVSYTFAKFVRKRKGMEPGKVLISKEKVLLVRPEIPKDTEQIYE